MKSLLLTCSFYLLFLNVMVAQGIPPRNEINLDEVYSQYNLTGEDVVYVMIDRGIDYRHPDFIDENGNTRLLYIYDMLNPAGAGSNPYGVGTIFTEAEINQALTNNDPPLSTDRGGHGTATTGIAAGNGSGTTSGEFQGVAPKVKIISIKLTQDGFPPFGSEPGQTAFFDATYIPIALQFAADKIAEIGLPSVTLMNIGSIGGPTDGTSSYCQAIDDFVALGNTFVCGVGDDGGQSNHAAGTINQGQTVEVEIAKGDAGFLRMDLWYSEDDRFTVSVQRPNGTTVGPFTAPSGANQSSDNNEGDVAIYHRGANTEFWGATSNRRELMIDLTGVAGTYKVILQGASITSGDFHATLNPSTYFNANKFNTFAVAGYNINDYSSAQSVISPGDYVIKNDWFDINGNFQDITGQGENGEIWLGSSWGPTQDDRLGIDFVAPGEVCHAAYADNTYYESFAFNVLQNSNGFYGIQNAVSAAAPISVGVIALMLEVNPNLTPSEIKQILQQSARQDSNTGSSPNATWGYGKLDALETIEQTYASLFVEETNELNFTLYPNPTSGELLVNFSESIAQGKISVYSIVGKKVSEIKFSEAQNLSIQILGNAGMYFVTIETNKGSFTKKVVKN